MTEQNVEMKQAKAQLRNDLIAFRVYEFFNDVFDLASMCICYVLTVLFHVIALLLLVIHALLAMADLRAGAGLAAELLWYYSWCMEEIEQRADSISVAAGRIAKEAAKTKRVARAALNASTMPIFGRSDHEIIINKIQLTRNERKALSAEVSAFLVFILRAATFTV
jgi:hypothetical protein